MLSEVQPCFQLLRIGPSSGSSSDAARDLYTFRPALPRCVFRLGRRAELCDVTLQSESRPELISRIHAELQAQKEEEEQDEGWRVYMVDHSSHGTWVNDSRLKRGERTELSDGDTLTFGEGDQAAPGSDASPEFYFLFQKVLVRPQEFDAITVPKASSFTTLSGQPSMLPSAGRVKTLCRTPELSAPLPSNKATVILNSIGSISKLQARPLTFHPEKPPLTRPRALSATFTPPPASSSSSSSSCYAAGRSSKSRRKSAHTVLAELEDEVSEEVRQAKRRHCKSESDAQPPQAAPCHSLVSSFVQRTPKGQRRRLPSSGNLYSPLLMSREHCGRLGQDQSDGSTALLHKLHMSSAGKRRGRPRKHPLVSGHLYVETEVRPAALGTPLRELAEPCASPRCRLPQQDTVKWVQCDDCDAWYHVDCAGWSDGSVQDAAAEFHCGCR
ncbi:transcription factor 19-like protein [Amia ocellicauda]|uniref:transcription factor 19-like protein n=1 Tax=Amia ocellicauda TaxID=2972642 RepID=UPI003463F21A